MCHRVHKTRQLTQTTEPLASCFEKVNGENVKIFSTNKAYCAFPTEEIMNALNVIFATKFVLN